MSKNGSMSEMERIQRGLEAFLQQELEGMQEQPQSREPQLFNIKDTNDESNSSKKDQQAENRINESDDLEEYDEQDDDMRGYEYHEDWDSKEHVAQMKTIKKQQKRAASQNTRETSKKKTEKTKKKRKKSKFKRFCMFLLVFLALLAGGMYYVVGKVYNKMEYEEIEALATAPMQEEGVVNILLIGNDSRSDGEDGRSDAMILLSVSKKTEKIYMTSLLRDMYVEIPGYKGNRLNAAYAYGGAELLMDTIEHNFDITVNRYVLVNFEAFANVVDAVGGIELELSSQEVEYVNAYLWEYNVLTNRPEGTDYMDTSVSGLVHLNGAQALSYTRNRYLGTDFGRTERQRKVLAQIIQKLPKAMVTNPKELINGLTTNLTTNLTQQECVQLCFWAAGALSYDMEQNSIPLEGTYTNATIRDMSVLEVDFETNKEFIRKNIYGEEE
ncbi:MAG: LCP family protein [Lachnospiraceae bacterium]|nr:LCP family protein [Lachnospiraceae bacterium]